MRDERLGSYSIEITVAGIPILSRLKSMMRSLRLCPPPRNRIVVSPELRRPPCRYFGSVSGLCGRSVVRSALEKIGRASCRERVDHHGGGGRVELKGEGESVRGTGGVRRVRGCAQLEAAE